MEGKRFVTISRKWHNPQIAITVSNEGISLEMQMDDFVEALKRELETEGFVEGIKAGVGSATWIFRDKTFGRKVDQAAADAKGALHGALGAAIERIISGVKQESSKVTGK